jgi:hypothetical protein
VRLSILVLGRMRNRLRRDPGAIKSAAVLEKCFSAASRILADIANLLSGHQIRADEPSPAVLHDSAEQLRRMPAMEAVDHQKFAEGARLQIERTEAMRPWLLRFEGVLATLRANVTLRSSARSYWLLVTVVIFKRNHGGRSGIR